MTQRSPPDEASEFADEILAVVDSMNETMASLYDALAENATLAQQWQIEAQSAAADLRNANLDYSSLYGVNLYGADLRHARLNNANLRYAILVNADMRNAGLLSADLWSSTDGAKTGNIATSSGGSCPFSLPSDFRCVEGSTDGGTRWLP